MLDGGPVCENRAMRRATPAAPSPLNGALVAGAIAVQLGALLALPLAIDADPRWGLALAPVVLATNSYWSLVHEAIHGLLFANRRINDAAGRLLGILFAAPFRPLRTGHLLHHRFSRTPRERTEVFDPAHTPRWRAALAYYPRLVGGLYLAEVMVAAAALAPKRALAALERRLEGDHTVVHLVVRALREPGAHAELRADAAAIAALYGASLALYGAHWWMLAAALAGRAFLVSFADNAYHYGTALDAPRDAKNVRAPRWVEAALLNFTLHGVHHLHPSLPWHALRPRFVAAGQRYDERWLGALARQLRGPIAVGRLPRRD
jgi:fatty acid desaturase